MREDINPTTVFMWQPFWHHRGYGGMNCIIHQNIFHLLCVLFNYYGIYTYRRSYQDLRPPTLCPDTPGLSPDTMRRTSLETGTSTLSTASLKKTVQNCPKLDNFIILCKDKHSDYNHFYFYKCMIKIDVKQRLYHYD